MPPNIFCHKGCREPKKVEKRWSICLAYYFVVYKGQNISSQCLKNFKNQLYKNGRKKAS